MRASDGPHRKIGDVAALLGVKAHVLRYWESEFPMLRPKKTRGHHRMYSPEDVELVRTIRELLEERGFTIAGARRFLSESRKASPSAPPLASTARIDQARKDARALRDELLELRRSLRGFLRQLDHQVSLADRVMSVTVEQMVSRPIASRTRR